MFSSIRSRLWLTYAFLVAAALLIVAAVFVVYVIRNPLAYRQALVKLTAVQGVLLARQEEWENLPPDRLERLFARQGETLEARLLLLDDARRVIVDSNPSAPALDLRRLARLNQTTYDSEGSPWLFKARRLENGRTLIVATPRPRPALLTVLADELMPPLLVGGLMALVLALFLAFGVARWVADPLQRLVNAARAFSGEAARPLPVEGPREVRALLQAFNQMTARVQAGQNAQRAFVANVSHELKTPLTAIQGFAQAILDGTAGTPEAQRQAAQIIYDEAARLHRLALDLLDLARLDSGIADLKRDPLDLNALARGAVERFGPRAQAAGVRLDLELEPLLPEIPGDGDRLAQVLDNLLDNALKFTPSGGQIVIRTRKRGDELEMQVQDTGIGIAPEALPRIFERFYQADPSRQRGQGRGAGLGLSIAREIVAAHGGTISVRSAPGQGSTFFVRLPLQ
ncbi:MAG: HAMP domain-containing histidine kinase [Anaerolineales bacterium]|nr:HAMP domain-containing histidine kinase [Anaerolineales bacterium]MCX7753924.1 HAMP domain-containing histidine kinase [Anaerolineales bacterium]MDW8278003.1 HAMP domain-containing sensor histidine kinase [Anaerolineales bacterium]